MKKVVTFGEVMLRLTAPDYLTLQQSSQLDVSFAGSEANVAVSLANYGIRSHFVSALPNLPLSEKCLEELRGKKVCVEDVIRCGSRMGILFLERGNNIRPSKVYYDREHSSIAKVQNGLIDWDRIFSDADWFHWSGITPAISNEAAKECKAAILSAVKNGVRISCDINYRRNLWKYGVNAFEVMKELVQYCDLVIGNEEDCEQVFGIKPNADNSLEGHNVVHQEYYKSVCAQMMDLFPKCKVMSISLRGAINANHNTWGGVLYDGSNMYESRRYDISDIVDRVGSGDSFAAGIIFGLLSDFTKQHTVDFAVAASALKHTVKGDYNCFSIDDVEAILRGKNTGRISR